ncbi:TPA: ParA family protein [Vibrio parahaemolyticus]|uniref:ParA family protein n=2 Tax=Vibrio TaxID=662 RepID=UPI001DA811F3|nr:AAA family ATPase [Vibrio parahaemolyticus]EJG0413917.1 AAA family ATPase [Vibrio parahaemolyticus]EJG0418797.1 AAA family ATPase [Vibrio parahaemolyticus]
MNIISIINYKGGVGKTTVTANLAGELAFRGKKVLLLDMDAQASLTFSFVTPDYWDSSLKENKTIKSWFDSISEGNEPVTLSNYIINPKKVNKLFKEQSTGGKIDLICSHLGLINVDLELATLLGGANMTQTKKNYLKVHGKLRTALKNLANKEYDAVLIDCPPNFNIVTKNALLASDQILIPAKPDYLSTLGIDYLHRSVKNLVDEFNEYASIDSEHSEVNPEFLGVIFTMIQIYSGKPISAQRQFISQTRRLGIPVMDSNFRENKTIFSEAPQYGMPVVLNSYKNDSHSEVVGEIEEFVNEFELMSGI